MRTGVKVAAWAAVFLACAGVGRVHRRAHRPVPAGRRPAGRDRSPPGATPRRPPRREPVVWAGSSGASRTTTCTWAGGAPRGGAGISGSPWMTRARSTARADAVDRQAAVRLPHRADAGRALRARGSRADPGRRDRRLRLSQSSHRPDRTARTSAGSAPSCPFRHAAGDDGDAVDMTHRSSPRRRAGPRRSISRVQRPCRPSRRSVDVIPPERDDGPLHGPDVPHAVELPEAVAERVRDLGVAVRRKAQALADRMDRVLAVARSRR